MRVQAVIDVLCAEPSVSVRQLAHLSITTDCWLEMRRAAISAAAAAAAVNNR